MLILLSIQSCESFIEIDLPDNQINTEDVFKDINTAKAALANLYSNVRNNSPFSGNSNGIGLLLGLYTDELESVVDAGSNTEIFFVYNNTLLPSNKNTVNLWNNSYKHIYSINAFIEGLTTSNYIDDNKNILFLAEAYVLRAVYYQYLTQIFGNIPYTTTTDYRYNTTITKTKVEDILIYIEQDLKTALEILPVEYRSSDRIYPNKPVAELLLAKNYLLQKQYAQAESFARKVLENTSYTLETDLNKVFKKTAKSTIWQLGLNASGNSTLEAATYIFNNYPNNQIINNTLLHHFAPTDKRREAWLKEVTQNDEHWFHPFKYKNNENNTDEYSIVFRIEDAYFILIEALANQNRTVEATKYLNTIRKRAGLTELDDALSQSELIDEMLNESQKEFFCEHGHRFFDLKRNNRLHTLKTIKLNWKDKHNLFPIPENEILLNPKLLPQNEGY